MTLARPAPWALAAALVLAGCASTLPAPDAATVIQQAQAALRGGSSPTVAVRGASDTEPLSGSDAAQGLRTTATRDGDNWVINGAKRWIGNGSISDITIIWAKDTEDGQVKGFIVPTSTPGYVGTRIENKQALRIVQNADILLDGVRVDESDHELDDLAGRVELAAALAFAERSDVE